MQVIFQCFTEIENGRHGTISIFLYEQKLNAKISHKLFTFYNHIPHDM